MENADVIRELARRWNAGDVEGVLELYTDDAVMLSGEDWPEQTFSGTMPVATLCTIRRGKIASVEWFTDYDAAVAAARGA